MRILGRHPRERRPPILVRHKDAGRHRAMDPVYEPLAAILNEASFDLQYCEGGQIRAVRLGSGAP